MARRRLDAELVRRGLAGTPGEAREVVLAGRVTVAGRALNTPATMVAPSESVAVRPEPVRFVSRGGAKLEAGLTLLGVDPAGRDCLDAGASTGGFTDRLLRGGARRVIAVDVGYGQLDWGLRNDERVTVFERTNVRELDADDLPFRPDLVVADLSFISLRSVIPALIALGTPTIDLVLLVKPQFEASRAEVEPGGVVRDPRVWRRVIEEVAGSLRAQGATATRVVASPLLGPAGNVEFLLHASTGGPPGPRDVAGLDEAIAAGEAIAPGQTSDP